jgi:hypothetical protein
MLQAEGIAMLEAAGSFVQAIANTILSSRHGEAELLLGLLVGLFLIADFLRGREADDRAGDLEHRRP